MPTVNTAITTTVPWIEEKLERSTASYGEMGASVSQAIHGAVMAGGGFTRGIADFLHGTWLGHPLHPILTDITVGAWSLGAMFDAASIVMKDDELGRMADRLVQIGTISAVPTAITGLTDFSTIPEWAASSVSVHGTANLVSIGLYTWSIRERRAGNRTRGVVISSIAYGLSAFSAWLGGSLVYKHKVGVDHSDTFKGPKVWTPVLAAIDLDQRKARTIDFEGKAVMLYRDGDAVYAIGNKCSHAGGPLNEAKEIHGACVQCPWHDSVFDMRDGSIVHGPATQPQPAFEARIRDGHVELRLMYSKQGE